MGDSTDKYELVICSFMGETATWSVGERPILAGSCFEASYVHARAIGISATQVV